MSITVRTWSSKDLEAVKSNTDPFLTTVFLNKKTFNLEEIRAYPYALLGRTSWTSVTWNHKWSMPPIPRVYEGIWNKNITPN